MRQVALGNLGLQLSPIGLGTMPLAIAGRPSASDAARLLRRALDAGINWLDTADSYCLDDADVGYGERLIAQTLRDAGSPDVMVTTKGGWIRPGGEWIVEASPDRLKAACEASLRALGVDSIFLYQLHAPDPKVPFSDSVGALADLQRAGKIRNVGLSNVDLGHIHQAQREVEVRLVQNRCNLFDQASFENGVIDYCRARQIPFVAHSPIGGHQGHVRALESSSVRAVAQRRGFSEKEVCLLWLLAQDGILPIPGATRAESLDSNLRMLSQALDIDDLAQLAAGHPRRKGLQPALLQTRNNLRWLGRALQKRLR